MFHVELKLSGFAKKGKSLVFFLFLFLTGCGIARPKMEIYDYLILEHGKEILGHSNLNTFVFENSQRNFVFQQYISSRYKTNSFYERELWINISGEKYKLIFYDLFLSENAIMFLMNLFILAV